MTFKEWMKANQHTQATVAAAIGVTQATVSRALAGQGSLAVLKKMRALTGNQVSLDAMAEPGADAAPAPAAEIEAAPV